MKLKHYWDWDGCIVTSHAEKDECVRISCTRKIYVQFTGTGDDLWECERNVFFGWSKRDITRKTIQQRFNVRLHPDWDVRLFCILVGGARDIWWYVMTYDVYLYHIYIHINLYVHQTWDWIHWFMAINYPPKKSAYSNSNDDTWQSWSHLQY